MAKRKPRPGRLRTFRGEDGDWYWRLLAANGEPVGGGLEGYTRKADAKRAALRAQQIMATAVLIEEG